MKPSLALFASLTELARFRVALAAFLICLALPVQAQDSALFSAVDDLVAAYLRTGPDKKELSEAQAQRNWALVESRALPEFLSQPGLKKGSWTTIWEPITKLLKDRGFEKMGPLEALSLWEETRAQPPRFVRLLGRKGLIDPKKPAERKKARALQLELGAAALKLPHLRSSIRFEKLGWSYTGTVSLVPGQRLVRVALLGSQPCEISGRVRTVNLSLKGRLFEDKGSQKGYKVQVLESNFKSQGCELNLASRLNTQATLVRGGRTRIAGSLTMKLTDNQVEGRLQLDLVSRQPGQPLLTGRAIYKLRGEMSPTGELSVRMIPVSTSGSRVLKEGLDQTGQLTGKIKKRQATGKLELPLCVEPIAWRANALDDKGKAGSKAR